jgi:hypothetical protein
MRVRGILPALTVAMALATVPARAEMRLPPGFRAHPYVSGEGFDTALARGTKGIPSSSTLAVDAEGVLYLARTGRRYMGGEVEDVFPIYRIPAGGARLTPATESRFLFGPPLPNPQIAAIRDGRELFVTTFDRDRKVGVLYRLSTDVIELFAGGTPERGAPPLLQQPEGAAVDGRGQVYVADRAQNAVVQLDPGGRVLNPEFLRVVRPRLVAVGPDGIWVGCDGAAEAPWQLGPGEIWRVAGDGPPAMVLRGPVATAMAVGPGGHLWVADRQGAQVFLLDAEGRRTPFGRFSDGDAPRSLAFVPVTPATRAAGIAGDLLVVVIRQGAWPVNEILRIAGPFDDYAQPGAPRPR